MTRDEAIAHGKEQLEVFGGEHAEFIKLAIKALEKEPCADAISRKSMLDYLKYLHGEMSEEEFVKALPSVTPTRPAGHWIDHSDEGYVECSNCGSATNCDGNIADLHFCFSCGAKMDEEEFCIMLKADKITAAIKDGKKAMYKFIGYKTEQEGGNV